MFKLTLSFTQVQVPALLGSLHAFKATKKGNDFLLDTNRKVVIVSSKRQADLDNFYTLNSHLVSRG